MRRVRVHMHGRRGALASGVRGKGALHRDDHRLKERFEQKSRKVVASAVADEGVLSAMDEPRIQIVIDAVRSQRSSDAAFVQSVLVGASEVRLTAGHISCLASGGPVIIGLGDDPLPEPFDVSDTLLELLR